MGKKKAGGKKEGGGAAKVSNYKPVVIPSDNTGWTRVNLKLVNWTFDNQIVTINTSKTLYSLARHIRDKHGPVKELKLFKGSTTNEVTDMDATLADLGFEGVERPEDAKMVNVYYDFKSVTESNPLLLVTPRTL